VESNSNTIFLIIFYAVTVVPTLLFARETKTRLRNLRQGIRSLAWLPLTVGGLLAYVFFAMDFMSSIPVLNWSWLGYNIALGPTADQGLMGVLPFVPMLVYMLIHVNYFEEMYFRKSALLTVVWAFLHVAMGVAVHVAIALLPIGFFYKYLYRTKGLNHAYALHFATNIVVVAVSVGSYLFI
jgi:membrane protease YdiL (CAAX protease family)